jgi:hypothetical protein
MALHHWQSYCPRCKRPTLHVRSTPDVPHVLHLVVTLFLCGLWLPVWILHSIASGSGEPWRCTGCGMGRGLFGRVSSAKIVTLDVKPAGPSTRAKANGGDCPNCGAAMLPGAELGDPVWNCPGCGQVFGR